MATLSCESIFDSLITPNRWRHYGKGSKTKRTFCPCCRCPKIVVNSMTLELPHTSKKPWMLVHRFRSLNVWMLSRATDLRWMKGLPRISVLGLYSSWIKGSGDSIRFVVYINWSKYRPSAEYLLLRTQEKKAVNMMRLPRFGRRMPQLWTFELFLPVRLCWWSWIDTRYLYLSILLVPNVTSSMPHPKHSPWSQ